MFYKLFFYFMLSIIFRSYFRLPKVNDWTEINPELFAARPELLGLLVAAYNNRLDNVDVYVGGMLESDGKPGELFTAVIREQFVRIRDADRFWFENENGYNIHSFFYQFCSILYIYSNSKNNK